jgi:hypothetical protein
MDPPDSKRRKLQASPADDEDFLFLPFAEEEDINAKEDEDTKPVLQFTHLPTDILQVIFEYLDETVITRSGGFF